MRRWPGGAAAAPQRRDVGGSVEDYLSEKEQWEWIKTQVRENGPAVIVAVALGGGGGGGGGWGGRRPGARRAGGRAEEQPKGAGPGGGGRHTPPAPVRWAPRGQAAAPPS